MKKDNNTKKEPGFPEQDGFIEETGTGKDTKKTGKGKAESAKKTGKGKAGAAEKTGKGKAESAKKTGKGKAESAEKTGTPEGNGYGIPSFSKLDEIDVQIEFAGESDRKYYYAFREELFMNLDFSGWCPTEELEDGSVVYIVDPPLRKPAFKTPRDEKGRYLSWDEYAKRCEKGVGFAKPETDVEETAGSVTEEDAGEPVCGRKGLRSGSLYRILLDTAEACGEAARALEVCMNGLMFVAPLFGPRED